MDEKKLYYKEDSKNVHKYLTVTNIVCCIFWCV